MTPTHALDMLNRATQPRIYTIRRDGDAYILVSPYGDYPARDEWAIMQQMIRMAHAAEGRGAR